MSLFYFFGGRKTDRAGLGGGYIPRRWRPLPTPAHPERLSSTGSSAGRARCKANNATHRHTRPDAGHAAPVCHDTRQAAPGRSGWRRALESGQRVRNCADTDTHKPPCIKSHFCDVLLHVQRFCPLQSHTSVIL